jgi:hypothetical protein
MSWHHDKSICWRAQTRARSFPLEACRPGDTMRSCAETNSAPASIATLHPCRLPKVASAGHCPSAVFAQSSLTVRGRPRAGQRDLQAAHRDQHHGHAAGQCDHGTTAMQKRFLDAGFPPKMCTCWARRAQAESGGRIAPRNAGREAGRLFSATWTWSRRCARTGHTDPFEFVEKDGYYYGRGTQDMKDSDAALVATFLRLHREGYKPKRDLILALTADEEGGKFNGADWLVKAASRAGGCGLCHQSRCRRRGTGSRPRRGGRC